jgi:ferredoxin
MIVHYGYEDGSGRYYVSIDAEKCGRRHMGKEVTISVDSRAIHPPENVLIIEAADGAGIYIPRLCHHPDLPPGPGTKASSRVYRGGKIHEDKNPSGSSYDGCNICVVEIEGRGFFPSCSTRVEDGMVIHVNTPALKEMRRNNLARIVSLHPHACLLCAEKDGCDQDDCTEGVDKNGRCCPRFESCEFQRVCEYVTIKDDVSGYVFRNIPPVDTPLFTYDPNLCIGCTRCVRACEKMQGKRIVDFSIDRGEVVVGTTGPSHRESGCVFCGACVTVCPTGALMDKGLPWKKKDELRFASVVLPPEDNIEATEENRGAVPESNGVYELLDEKQKVIFIRGAGNIRKDLQERLQTVKTARFFRYEEHGMYTMRENEKIERFLKTYGTLPEVNNEISDLY